jgi:drug/metabolite transporter (DMT)-like permease
MTHEIIGSWLFLALGSALGTAGADAVTKRHFGDLSPYAMSLAQWLYPLPILLAVGLFTPWPHLDQTFWMAVAAALPLEVAATLLYMRALKVCHLSLCIPLLAFTPVFMILTGWLFLGEALSQGGLVGIALISGGGYILSLGSGPTGIWAPLKALVREEKGAILMLIVAAIYSCTASLGKLAILHSEPVFFGVAYPLCFSGVMLLGYPVSQPRPGPALWGRYKFGLVVGFCMAGSIFCHVYGIVRAPAAYMVAVKRLSILFSVLLGGLWLQERPFLPRLLGAGLMVAGVIIIALCK